MDGLEGHFLSSRKYMLEAVTFNAANGDPSYKTRVKPENFLLQNENRDFLIIQEIQPDFEKYFEVLPDKGKNYKLITGLKLDEGLEERCKELVGTQITLPGKDKKCNVISVSFPYVEVKFPSSSNTMLVPMETFAEDAMGIVYNKEKFEPLGELHTANIRVSGSKGGTHGAIIQVFRDKKSNKKIKIINIHTGHNYGDNVKQQVIQKIVELQDFGDSDIMITAGDFNELSYENPKLIEGVIGDGFNVKTETHKTHSLGILDQIGIKTKEEVKKKAEFEVLGNYGSDHNAVLLKIELN